MLAQGSICWVCGGAWVLSHSLKVPLASGWVVALPGQRRCQSMAFKSCSLAAHMPSGQFTIFHFSGLQTLLLPTPHPSHPQHIRPNVVPIWFSSELPPGRAVTPNNISMNQFGLSHLPWQDLTQPDANCQGVWMAASLSLY